MRSEEEIRKALEGTLRPPGIVFVTHDSEYRKSIVECVLEWVLNDRGEK